MSIRKIVQQIQESGFNFEHIPANQLIKNSMNHISDYELTNCPACGSVDTTIKQTRMSLYFCRCLTCQHSGTEAALIRHAVLAWNNERIQS